MFDFSQANRYDNLGWYAAHIYTLSKINKHMTYTCYS